MSKFLVAVLAAGAAAAAGYVASQFIKGKNSANDYDDDDMYDDVCDACGGDDNIDFEINDDSVKEAVEEAAEEAEEAVEEAIEEAEEAIEEAIEEIKD